MRCNGGRVIRYSRCTRMHVADFSLHFSLSYVFHLRLLLSLLCLLFTLHLSSSCLSVFLPLSLSYFLSPSLSVTHTNAEVIISGRLGVKVCYDKHAAVVINFE